MLKTLRSRLLLSYVMVILVALLVVAVAMLAFASQPGIRYFVTLQRLDDVSRTSSNELVRLVQAGATDSTIIEVLNETAVQNSVRILVLEWPSLVAIYDSNQTNSWLGDVILADEIPRRFLPSTDANTRAAIYQRENSGRWVLYSRALFTASGVDRQMVMYAMPEPTPLAFFNELGFSQTLLQAGAVALVVAILLGLGIGRSVARPLQKLASAAEAIAAGNYKQQLPLQGPEEVQRVASSFNSMSAEVNHTRNAQRDFVANVSHDLKTPITAIRGWSQALLDGTAVSAEEQQQAATVIYNESERMGRMVEELLDLARIESGQLRLQHEPLDLQALLTAVYQTFLPRAQQRHIALQVDLQPIPAVYGDYDRLVQLFANLIDNALAHTAVDGQVSLTLQVERGMAVVQVRDNGKGMAPEELNRVFERFYQVDKSRARADGRRGLGLGLAIVKQLVDLHQGKIELQSQLGQGSHFTVYLPLADSALGQHPT